MDTTKILTSTSKHPGEGMVEWRIFVKMQRFPNYTRYFISTTGKLPRSEKIGKRSQQGNCGTGGWHWWPTGKMAEFTLAIWLPNLDIPTSKLGRGREMEAGWMCDYNWRSDFQNDPGVTSAVQTSEVSSVNRRMPRLWTSVHQLDGLKPWTLLQPAQCFSGNTSATRSVAESWQSQGTLVLLQRFCSNRLWKLSRCVEGWLCFTQRILYVFLTGGSNTFMKTPAERGRKAWML